MEVSIQESEETEVTYMSTERSLLEEMLSDENLNKAYQ